MRRAVAAAMFGALVLVAIGGIAAAQEQGPDQAQEKIDLATLILDPPAPGFQSLSSAEGGVNGPVTHEGEAAPAGYRPPSSSGFVRGQGRTFLRVPATGEVIYTIVAEWTTPAVAKLSMRNDRDEMNDTDGVFRAVTEIPEAQSFEQHDEGATTRTIEFRYGKYLVLVVHYVPDAEDPGPTFALGVARLHYDHAVASLPAPEPVDSSEDAALNAGYSARRWFRTAMAVVAFFSLAAVGFATLVVYRNQRRAAAAPAAAA